MQISKEQLDTLPKDFDWKYYLHIHPDLGRAEIKTKEMAEYHYITHGKKENRLYKPPSDNHIVTSIIKNQKENHNAMIKELVLFTQWYVDNETEKNRQFCLNQNIENENIDKIHIFVEIGAHQNLLDNIDVHPKVNISFIKDRLSYSSWMRLANDQYASSIKILANSDIFFDDTIKILLDKDFNKHTLYDITRKDLDKSGNIVSSCDYYGDQTKPIDPLYSQDVWIYGPKLKSDISLFNFSLGIENCDKIFKKELLCNKINLINLYQEINAIHVDYRTQKKRPSYDLNNYKKREYITEYNIGNILDKQLMHLVNNKLENICLLLNGKELEDGQYEHFLKNFANSIKSSEENSFFASLIDFNIYTQYDSSSINIEPIKDIFNNVKIIHIDIPEKYDFYNHPKPNSDLLYGYKSGPNYCFFKAFEYLTTYNTTLFLECDVVFGNNWLERIYNYTRFSDCFWVSGATYSGKHLQNLSSIVSRHINGGICLYATSNPYFLRFVNFCFNMTPLYIKHHMDHMPYDYIIYQIIEDFYDFDHDNREICQFIVNQYKTNNLILNYSTNSDIDVDINEIQKKYNPALIHIKKPKMKDISEITSIPHNFDHYFYARNYPWTKDYYNLNKSYSFRHKMYHHYICYGKNAGYYINQEEQLKSTTNQKILQQNNEYIIRGMINKR